MNDDEGRMWVGFFFSQQNFKFNNGKDNDNDGKEGATEEKWRQVDKNEESYI